MNMKFITSKKKIKKQGKIFVFKNLNDVNKKNNNKEVIKDNKIEKKEKK